MYVRQSSWSTSPDHVTILSHDCSLWFEMCEYVPPFYGRHDFKSLQDMQYYLEYTQECGLWYVELCVIVPNHQHRSRWDPVSWYWDINNPYRLSFSYTLRHRYVIWYWRVGNLVQRDNVRVGLMRFCIQYYKDIESYLTKRMVLLPFPSRINRYVSHPHLSL